MYNKIYNYLKKLNDNELIEINNEYANILNDPDEYIYYMNELDDVLSDFSPTEIIKYCSDINLKHLYFKKTPWGWKSAKNIYDFMPIDEIALSIIEYNDDLGNENIAKLLENEVK